MVQIEKIIHGGGKVDKYKKAVDIKAFLMELHAFFVKEHFKDILGEDRLFKKNFLDGWAKAGEFVDNKGKGRWGEDVPNNRTADMFEKKYVLVKKGWANELEITWECFHSAPHSPYGWYEVKIDLVVRDMKDIEIMEDGKKKTMQMGTWEFRNAIVYKNSYFEDYLEKLPFIKNSKSLQKLVLTQLHGKLIKYDFDVFGFTKLKPGIYNIIEKHFA